MKQDGTECGLLRNVDADMANACEKHFTSVAQQQASTVGHQQPKERTTTSTSSKQRTYPAQPQASTVDHQHRKEHTTRYKSYTSTGNKQRTHPAHMYDFSQMKQDGTECHLLRDADMAYACKKHFHLSPETPISVARQQTFTVGRQHRKEDAVKYKPYKTRTGSKYHVGSERQSAQNCGAKTPQHHPPPPPHTTVGSE